MSTVEAPVAGFQIKQMISPTLRRDLCPHVDSVLILRSECVGVPSLGVNRTRCHGKAVGWTRTFVISSARPPPTTCHERCGT